jgi:hypothetical protein
MDLSCGMVPNRLPFPVVACTLLGCDVISDAILIDSFVDYISTYESSVFREALQVSKDSEATFTPVLGDFVLNILSTMGCREMPIPGNIQQLILQVARYELVSKPLNCFLFNVVYLLNTVLSLVAFQLVTYVTCTKLLMPPQGRL